MKNVTVEKVIHHGESRTKSCKLCPVRSQCTRSKNGRLLLRSIFTEYYETNRRNYQEKEHLYKRRQAIVEHPFGTIKRSRLPSGGIQLYPYKEGNQKGKC